MTEKDFLKVYEELADKIFRHCFFRLPDREDALDITQETFLRAWEYIWKGKKIDNPKTFIYQIASNRIVDYFRKKKTYSLEDLESKGFEPEDETLTTDSLIARLDGKTAFEKLRELPDIYRQIILFRFSDEMTITEIAKILGESDVNVSVRIYRALKKLKDLMEPTDNNSKEK